MSFQDFIEVFKMVKEAGNEMRAGRFWSLLVGVVYLGTIYAPVVTTAIAAILK